jgi:tetratricopeptide (TPR) repeat protein
MAEVRSLAPLAAQEAAERGAHRQAAALYACALDALGADGEPALRAELIDRQCDELYLAGNEPSIIERRRQALDLWRRLGRRREQGRALRQLSRQYWSLGDSREAVRQAEAALALLEPLQDDAEFGWALSTRSQLFMLASAYRDAVAFGTRAIALAERLGEPGLLAHALNNVGTSKTFLGEVESGVADLERSLTIALTHHFDDHSARALVNLVVTLTELKRYANAEAVHAQAAEFFAHRDLDSYRDYVAGWRARLHFERGRWAQAEAEARLVVGTPFELNRLEPLLLLGRLAAYRDEPAPTAWLERAEAVAQLSGELQRLVPVALARAETQWLATGTVVNLHELKALFERARQEGAREYVDELAYWLWRAGAGAVDGIDLAGPRGLQIQGRWHEAAQRWEDIGSPVGRYQALSEGDTPAIDEACRWASEWGARGWLKRLQARY